MQPITHKIVKVVSGSSIALSILSILGTAGIFYMLIAMLKPDVLDSLFGWFTLAILGISTYYFAFSVLSWAYIRTKRLAAAHK